MSAKEGGGGFFLKKKSPDAAGPLPFPALQVWGARAFLILFRFVEKATASGQTSPQ